MTLPSHAERPGLISAEEVAAATSGDGWSVLEILDEAAEARDHIPGAVVTSLHRSFALRRSDRGLEYDVPSSAEFATEIGRLGIRPDASVVLADANMNRWATRAYWLFRYYRHSGQVRVLDGGLNAYRACGLPAAAAARTPTPVDYPVPAHPDESIRMSADQLASALADGSAVACDVRAEQEYSGELAMSGRGGHLPGAVHVGWERCLGPDGRFLEETGLRRVLAPFLETEALPVTYCQGGIRASLTWFALNELLGRPARLYAGSWEDWAQRTDLPVEI